MSVSKSAWLVIGVVAGFASGAASFAIAQATQKEVLTTLENNQGILVDKTNFNVIKGASSTGDPLAAIRSTCLTVRRLPMRRRKP
jgi:hypothetical protein